MSESPSLFVATYEDASTALSDYQRLENAERLGQLSLEGIVVLSRTEKGTVIATTTGNGLLCSGPLLHRDTALVVGLFAPSLLLATAVGAGIGSEMAELVKKHDEGKIGVSVDTYLAQGSSTILVLLDFAYLAGTEMALSHCARSIATAVDWDDFHAIERVVATAGVGRRLTSELITNEPSSGTPRRRAFPD